MFNIFKFILNYFPRVFLFFLLIEPTISIKRNDTIGDKNKDVKNPNINPSSSSIEKNPKPIAITTNAITGTPTFPPTNKIRIDNMI